MSQATQCLVCGRPATPWEIHLCEDKSADLQASLHANLQSALQIAASLAAQQMSMALYQGLNPNLYQPKEKPVSDPKPLPQFKMNRVNLITTIFFIVLGLWDMFCVAHLGVGYSVSNFIAGSSEILPTIPFVFGFVAGHLFGPLKRA